MVIYDLVCPSGHRFEGWFPNREAFEAQQKKGLLHCQVCGETTVSKLPTGGHTLGFEKKGTEPSTEPAKDQPATQTAFSGPMDQVTMIKALRHYVKTQFENVGNQFSTLAREIHKGETPQKNIYGQVTPEERQKLEEDEIPHLLLPELPPEFEN